MRQLLSLKLELKASRKRYLRIHQWMELNQ